MVKVGTQVVRRQPLASLQLASATLLGLVIAGGLLVGGGNARGEGSARVEMDKDVVREGPSVIAAGDRVGVRVADVGFTDLEGKAGKLSDYADRKALVICITSAACPVSKKYGPTLAEIEAKYRGKGVAFLAVNVSANESGEKMKEQAGEMKKQGWGGRYVADREQSLAKALGVRSTTEVFVLDRARTLVYRGAVDDQYGLGYALAEARKHYLAAALDAVLVDDRPGVEATTAPGCALTIAKAGENGRSMKAGEGMTYHNRISRIVQSHCAECHRNGENAPFELASYADAKEHSAMIKKVVGRRTMPPWFADKTMSHEFSSDRSLSDRDREDLIAWIDAGMAEGNAADGPVARKFVTGWRIGKPDLVLEANAQNVPAKGTVPYRYALAQTKLTEDKWVSAVEIRPSAPEVVHHLLVFISLPPSDPRAKQYKAVGGGLNGYFAGMVPGQGAIAFPEGTAKLLPKGATLVFQIHYTTNGKEAVDHPRIGLKFADAPPKYELQTKAAATKFFSIPPNAGNHEISATYTLFNKSRLISLNPHAHVRGKAFRYELFYPDGKSEVILEVPRYDFNWQMEYVLARPIDVPAGTRLKVTGWYDNSKENPANPNPNKAVRFGEQTWDEMMIGYFTGHVLE